MYINSITYIHTYIEITYTYAQYIHTYINTCTYIHTCTFVHTCTSIHVHTYIHTYTCISIHTYTCISIHTYIHTYIPPENQNTLYKVLAFFQNAIQFYDNTFYTKATGNENR